MTDFFDNDTQSCEPEAPDISESYEKENAPPAVEHGTDLSQSDYQQTLDSLREQIATLRELIARNEEEIRKYRADEINRKNASLSAGSVGKGHAGEYFSPDEVRAMTQREVHDNYSKIKESMRFWN